MLPKKPPFPSTFKQVVDNMRRIAYIVDNYVQKLIDTIFNPDAWISGETDLKFDEETEKLKVIGNTILTDNIDTNGKPSDYVRNLTWEIKSAEAIGLSGMPHVGQYMTVMTVRTPDMMTWQVAYSDDRMTTYFRNADLTNDVWNAWESVGRKQFVESETQPADNEQDVGDYWYQPVDVGTPDPNWTDGDN